MPAKKLSRTTYRDPMLNTNPIRTGDSTRGENAADMDEYYLPMFELHGSGLHDWGVASGLEVTATNGQQSLKVKAGIAVDSSGRSISLAVGGNAEVGTNDPPTPATPVGVEAGGATIPTAGITGPRFVTIEWWEALDSDGLQVHGLFRYNHTPWIRLRTTAQLDEGKQVVLARVTLSAGNVTGLTTGRRRNVGLHAETINLRKGHRSSGSPNYVIDDIDYATIKPRDGGGLDLRVPNATDDIHIGRDDGNFDTLSIAAREIFALRNDGLPTVKINTNGGSIRLGTAGVSGDVLVKNSDGTFAIELRGASGDIRYKGRLLDPQNRHPGITHNQLKNLTDGGITGLHKHLIGRFDHSGNAGSSVGVTSGRVYIDSPSWGSSVTGSVALRFSDRTAIPQGVGYSSNHMHGYRGNFTTRPQVIVAPTRLNLSTKTDTWFGINYSVTSSELTVSWSIDGYQGGQHRIDFLVIGYGEQ